MNKVKYTTKDFKQFQSIFMESVSKLGLTEWRYDFRRSSDDSISSISADLEQRAMSVRFTEAVEYDKSQVVDKGKEIRDAAEHEAIEVLLYPVRLLACKGRGDDIWNEADTMCHTIINRIQFLVFG